VFCHSHLKFACWKFRVWVMRVRIGCLMWVVKPSYALCGFGDECLGYWMVVVD